MSAVQAAPAVFSKLDASLHEDRTGFVNRYQSVVCADVKRVDRKIRKGERFELIVMPERVSIRDPFMALTHVDVSSERCRSAILLKKMFRREAIQHGLKVKKTRIEIIPDVRCCDPLGRVHLEDVPVLVVYFEA
jgi:hypothetical protein